MFNVLYGLVVALLAACSSTPAQNSTPAAAVKDAPPAGRSSRSVVVATPPSDGNTKVRVVTSGGDDSMIELAALAELDGLELDEATRESIQNAMKSLDHVRMFSQVASPTFDRNSPLLWRTRMINVEFEENAAFLGVSTEPVNPQTAAQLPIAAGTGLVLTMVEEDSPAATAGLKQMDVLARLNDQMLVNAEQLAVLIRANKPGDSLKMTYVRGGKESTVSVTLGSRRLPKLGPGGVRADGAFDPALAFVELNKNQNMPLTWARAMAPRASSQASDPDAPDSAEMSTMSLNYNTDDVSISITTEDGERHVTVKDLRGDEVIFDEDREPNSEELAKMRPEIRKDVQRLLGDMRKGKIRMMNPSSLMAPPAPPTPPVPPVAPARPSKQSAPAPEASTDNESSLM
jgi:hypothetical protein